MNCDPFPYPLSALSYGNSTQGFYPGPVWPLTQGLPLPPRPRLGYCFATNGARCRYFSSLQACVYRSSILKRHSQDGGGPFLPWSPHSHEQKFCSRRSGLGCWDLNSTPHSPPGGRLHAGRGKLRVLGLSPSQYLLVEHGCHHSGGSRYLSPSPDPEHCYTCSRRTHSAASAD